MSIVLTISIILGSTVLSSCFGFGAALLAMPLLTLLWGIDIATPLQALAGITASTAVVGTSWQNIQLKAAWRLLVGAVGGIPVGILAVRLIPERWMLIGLGSFLILYSLYRLTQCPLPLLQNPRWSYLFGFLSGTLGGAYNTNGPPVVLYGTIQGWSPPVFRATLQGYFMLTGIMTALGHGVAGLWTPSIFVLYLWCLPGIIGGVVWGHYWNRQFSPQRFETFLLGLIASLGCMLIVSAGR